MSFSHFGSAYVYGVTYAFAIAVAFDFDFALCLAFFHMFHRNRT